MSERSHRHNPAAHSRSRPTCAKRGGPSLTHRPDPTANFIRLRASAVVGPESRGSRRLPLFPRKEGQTRAELFHRKSSQCTQISLKDIACMLLAQTKDAKIVCVIGCQITRTRIHTLLKRLASARHDNREKTVLLPECTLQTKQSVKTKEEDDVFSRRPLYCGHAGSDVIGCRRPTGGVFIYVCFRHGSR